MTISVIIPTFARPKLLQESIDSVANQSLQPDEIIVVDGHPDGSAQATVKRFSDHEVQVVYVHHPMIGNVSRLRNVGVSTSKSKYVSFIDDDDMWDPHYLEYVVQLLSDEEVEAVLGSINYWDEEKVRRGRTLQQDVVLSDLFLMNPGVSGSGITMAKSLFEGLGGFDEQLPVSEDKDLFMRLLESSEPFRILSDARIMAREHDFDHLMASDNPHQQVGFQRFYEKYRSKMSLAQRRTMKAKIALAAYRSANTTPGKVWPGFVATCLGERAVVGDLLRKLGVR